MFQLIKENLKISLESIRSHYLRSILTMLIIAFGIMALVGILTSIDAVKFFLSENFSLMGANTFEIKNRSMRIQVGHNIKKAKYHEPISYDEAITFKDEFDFPVYTSVYTWGTGIATVKYMHIKSDPNVGVIGSDENYLITAGRELAEGRNFTVNELRYGSRVVIIGSDIKKKLFTENEDPINKVISIGPGKYTVVGVIKEKGSSMGFSGDRQCIIPITNVRQDFPRSSMSYTISVMAKNELLLETAIGEATGLFRVIRQDPVSEENSFEITKSDNLVEMFLENVKYIRYAAIFIGLITLLGAAIGLMNIMLVSVTERTREIGIRKAIGANKKTIKNQFLIEAIVIAQFGGIIGIVFGIIIGNILSLIIGSAFIIPWAWIVLGVVVCFIVAVISGLYPASKAAKFDPIESLRYE